MEIPIYFVEFKIYLSGGKEFYSGSQVVKGNTDEELKEKAITKELHRNRILKKNLEKKKYEVKVLFKRKVGTSQVED